MEERSSLSTATFELNLQQQAALEAMFQFIDGRDLFYVLKGYAGTGKTTITQILIKRCQSLRIALTASTHKAAQSLFRAAYQWGNEHLEAMTIHRLLGLVVRQHLGETYLSPEGQNRLDKYDLVLVDECSMVNQDLWKILQEQAQLSGSKFIFIGDPAQLPPVGETESATFAITPYSELTQVMRQAGGNPIGFALDQIRLNLEHTQPVPTTELIADNRQGIVSVKTRGNFLKFALKAFAADAFQSDPDYARLLAWRNQEVSKLNQFVRKQLYGESVPRFLPGERLMARDTVVDPSSGRILLNSCGEVTILSAEEGEAHGYKAWILEITTEEDIHLKLPILHEQAFSVFEETKQLTLTMALEANREAKLSRSRQTQAAQMKAWKEVERYNSLFANLDYCYALTVHKSQGSQFQNVFVLDRDLQLNSNLRERNQLRYVAYSRAVERLFILY